MKLERHETYRGGSTPIVEWRVWHDEHTFVPFRTKRDALEYMKQGR